MFIYGLSLSRHCNYLKLILNPNGITHKSNTQTNRDKGGTQCNADSKIRSANREPKTFGEPSISSRGTEFWTKHLELRQIVQQIKLANLKFRQPVHDAKALVLLSTVQWPYGLI